MSRIVAGLSLFVAGVLVGWLLVAESTVAATSTARIGAAPETPRDGRLPEPVVAPKEAADAEPLSLPDGKAPPTTRDEGSQADPIVGIVVYGSVTDPSGAPVEGSGYHVRFEDDKGTDRSVRLEDHAAYAISGLSPGRWTVRTDFKNHRATEATLVLDGSEPTVRFDLVVEPAVVLLVRVFTPEGQPLREALAAALTDVWNVRVTAVATLEPPGGDLPEISHRAYRRYGVGVFDDPSERFAMQGNDLPPDVLGTLEIDGQLPVHVSLLLRHVLLRSQRVEPGATEVVFTVPVEEVLARFGRVTLTVVDAETLAPLTSAHGELTDSQSSGGHDKPDEQGRFVWEQQRPGLLELVVTAEGYERWVSEVRVPAGGTADLGRLELRRQAVIRGRVVDTEGEGQSVQLHAYPADRVAETRSILSRWRHQSDGAGDFELWGTGRREYEIHVGAGEWAAHPVRVDATAGDVEDVVVTVERGTKLRLMTDWPATATYGIRVETSTGRIVSDSPSWRGSRVWRKRLVPGDYVVSLWDGARMLDRRTVAVSGEKTVVELTP